MKILHTDGEWRLVTENHVTPKIYVEHHCQANTSYKGTWVPMRFQYYQFSSPCGWCKNYVPEGLQGAFVLLTDSDMVTHENIASQWP
jgi:hypothetical protein